MKLILFLLALLTFAEFRAEVIGRPTVIGCFIRGLEGIAAQRCDTIER